MSSHDLSLRRRALLVVAIVVLFGAWLVSAPARGAVSSSSGVSATVFDGDLDVFYTGGDDGIWELSYISGHWRAALEVPGSSGALTSAPAADTFRSGTQVNVFYRNTAGGLSARSYTTGQGWSGVGNVGVTATSAPAADVFVNGAQVNVFFRNTAGGLSIRSYTIGQGWSSVSNLGGTLTSAPSSDVYGGGRQVNVFVRNSENGLSARSYTSGSGWSRWGDVPGTNGTVGSSPSSVVSPNGRDVYVFYVGLGGALWEARYDLSTGWSAPVEIPGTAGTVGSAPAAVTFGSGINVFYLSASNTGLRQVSSSDGQHWLGPVVPGPSAASAPPSAPSAPAAPSAPSSAPPAATRSGTTTIRPPRRRRGSRPRVGAAVSINWTWNSRGTRFASVRTARFPRTGRITIRCAGPRCPRGGVLRAGRRGLRRLWRRLEHRLYRPRDTVTFKITQPGHIAEVLRFHIRREKIPLAPLT